MEQEGEAKSPGMGPNSPLSKECATASGRGEAEQGQERAAGSTRAPAAPSLPGPACGSGAQ